MMHKERWNQLKGNRKLRVAVRMVAMVWTVALFIGGVSMNRMEVQADEEVNPWVTIGKSAVKYGNGDEESLTEYDYKVELDDDGAGDKYTIYTVAGLAWVANQVNTYSVEGDDVTGDNFKDDTITLANNINLDDGTVDGYGADSDNFNEDGEYEGVDWTAIGILNALFKGTFDGGNYTVSGVYINNEDNFQGLFGTSDGATIQNVGVVDSSISGNNYVGGVVGKVSSTSTVSNCYNTGDVSGGYDVGGVVGMATSTSTSTSMVSNCYNTGDVSGTGQYIGGVVGNVSNSSVSQCYNIGDVSGTGGTGGNVGGVVGYSTKTITNCYNIGDVSGTSGNVGGVVGYSSNTITNCYNTGDVSGTGTGQNVGGVVGNVSNSATVTNCYYNSDNIHIQEN